MPGRWAPSEVGRPPAPTAAQRGLPRASAGPDCYGPEVVSLLRAVWEASDYLCGKRLGPFLPPLVEVLERRRVER